MSGGAPDGDDRKEQARRGQEEECQRSCESMSLLGRQVPETRWTPSTQRGSTMQMARKQGQFGSTGDGKATISSTRQRPGRPQACKPRLMPPLRCAVPPVLCGTCRPASWQGSKVREEGGGEAGNEDASQTGGEGERSACRAERMRANSGGEGDESHCSWGAGSACGGSGPRCTEGQSRRRSSSLAR